MQTARNSILNVVFEMIAQPNATGEAQTYGFARVIAGTPSYFSSSLVLARLDDATKTEAVVAENDCIVLPSQLDARTALALPYLTIALRMWSLLALEPGEAAVYTTGDAVATLLGRIALWRGAAPVVCLGAQPSSDSHVEHVSTEDPVAAIERLSALVRGSPGFAAVDVNGSADVLEVLLETMPRWGRLLLGAQRSSRLTVDFYNNVHRKGARLVAARLGPLDAFDNEAATKTELQRALRILVNPVLASELRISDVLSLWIKT